jgi:hypothetical protein
MSATFGYDFNEVVKDLDETAHVGGFPAHAIVIEPIEGFFVIWKEDRIRKIAAGYQPTNR